MDIRGDDTSRSAPSDPASAGVIGSRGGQRPATRPKEASIAGTQSLRRALRLLQIIGNHPDRRLTLTDLVGLSGLGRATTHRLLTSLVEESFLFRETGSRSYHLGIEILALGLRAIDDSSYVERFRPLLRRVAQECGEAAFLTIREGDYCYCVQREDPPPPFCKPLWTHIGKRLLLTASGGGLAMLADCSDGSTQRYLKSRHLDLQRTGVTPGQLLRELAATRRRGYAILSEVVRGGSSVGIAFRIGAGVQAAVSVGGYAGPPDANRHKTWAKIIRRELPGDLAELVSPPPADFGSVR